MSIDLARWRAHQAIDEAAGEARLRYITDVPGQQAVYLEKLAQAQSYLSALASDANAVVPPYIAAEASGTGQTAQQVAQMVVGLGARWNDQLGPLIEGLRLGGKAAVRAAQTIEAVQQAADAAISALEQA